MVESKESSAVDKEEEQKKKKKWMTVSIHNLLPMDLIYLLTYGRRSLVSGTQNDLVAIDLPFEG